MIHVYKICLYCRIHGRGQEFVRGCHDLCIFLKKCIAPNAMHLTAKAASLLEGHAPLRNFVHRKKKEKYSESVNGVRKKLLKKDNTVI